MVNHPENRKSSLSSVFFATILISGIVAIVVFLLLYLPIFNPEKPEKHFYILPHLNGALNTLTTILLLTALVAIKRGKMFLHRNLMLTAFTFSLLFLISYIIYHASVPETPFGGKGMIRYLYYFILVSHILTSMIALPFVLTALYFGIRTQFHLHKRVVRWAYPMWLYVAISGVATYLFLFPYYPSPF
jgi:putative membrane protein